MMLLPPEMIAFLERGGPTLWVIAALSVVTLALTLWKLWTMSRLGVWSGAATQRALAAWESGDKTAAVQTLGTRGYLRADLARHAMKSCLDAGLDDAQAREETTRHARAKLTDLRAGLRALELIATTAPLLGLLGTVLGMIDAFQALQEAGSRADPAALAGGIWEALLTTAAGMAVAIPAGVALVWFESICDRVQADMEDIATRIFIRGSKGV